MAKYEIVRMPTEQNELQEVLEEYTPFLDAMYTENDRALFGEVNFILDHWLFLWDTGAGYFLTKRNDSGDLVMVAMLTQFRDLWSARPRLEIHRVAMADIPENDVNKEIDDMVEYLISVSSLMRFNLLYYNTREPNGNEHKELVWIGK